MCVMLLLYMLYTSDKNNVVKLLYDCVCLLFKNCATQLCSIRGDLSFHAHTFIVQGFATTYDVSLK